MHLFLLRVSVFKILIMFLFCRHPMLNARLPLSQRNSFPLCTRRGAVISPCRPPSLTAEHCHHSGGAQRVGCKLLSRLSSVLWLYNTFSDKYTFKFASLSSRLLREGPRGSCHWAEVDSTAGCLRGQTDVSEVGGWGHSSENLSTAGSSDAPAQNPSGMLRL